MVRRFSGHSLRAGYATSAAAADVPALRIQQHTRHKSADMVARYVRESDKWSKSGLKGILHRATREERSFLDEHFARATNAERDRLLEEILAFLATRAGSANAEARP